MNRLFFRLPYAWEAIYQPRILVVNPYGGYHWVIAGVPLDPLPQLAGYLSLGDCIVMKESEAYAELDPGLDLARVLGLHAADNNSAVSWREVLAPHLRRDPPPLTFEPQPKERIHTNHKLGAPKGKLP